MSNHANDIDSINLLADTWRSLPEDQRKKIFKAVAKSSPDFFNRLNKKIKGFTPKSIVTRPAAIITRLDKIVTTIEGGKELRKLLKTYFMDCNPLINDSFNDNFRLLCDRSPNMSTKQLTDRVLTLLNSEFKEDPLWDLYKKALPVCEPSQFSDDPPDLEMLSNTDEMMTNNSSVDSLTAVPSLQQDSNRIERDPGLPKIEPVAPPKIKLSKKADQKFILSKRQPNATKSNAGIDDYLTTTNIGEVIEQVYYKLKTMAVGEAEKIFHLHKSSRLSFNQDYQEYLTRKKELDSQLTEVRKLGLIHNTLSNESFMTPFGQFPVSDAIDRLLESISQATAILDKHKRLIELEDTLDISHEPNFCHIDKQDLKQLLFLLDNKLSSMEKLFYERTLNETLLLDFIARLESCDYLTARQFVKESTPEFWENFIRAVLLLGISKEHNVKTQPDNKKSTRIATIILQDPLIISLILSVLWQASSAVGLAILEYLASSHNVLKGHVLEIALSGLTFEQLQIVANADPYLAKVISRMTLLSALANQDLDSISWLKSFSHCTTSATISEIEFLRECVISHERGSLIKDMSIVFGIENKNSDSKNIQQKKLLELQKFSELHGLGGNFRKLRESAREHYIVPIMNLVAQNQKDKALELWEGYGNYDNMVQTLIGFIETIKRPEQRHLNKTIQYLRSFGKTLTNWTADQSQQTKDPTDPFITAFNNFNRVSGESEKKYISLMRSSISDSCSNKFLPAHFGKISNEAGRIYRSYVDPVHIENWITVCNSPSEETEAADLLGERLIHVLGGSNISLTPRDILTKLLARSEVIAAASLAAIHPDIKEEFNKHIEELQKATLTGHEDLWKAAHSAALADANVQFWTSEIEQLMEEFRFTEAKNYFTELKEAIQQYNDRKSDEYKDKIDFLCEAGRIVPKDINFINLRNEVQLLKNESFPTRQHIIFLENILQSPDYEYSFKEEMQELISEVDRPKHWLQPDDSKNMAEDLKIIFKFLEYRVRWRDARPDIYSMLNLSLASFIKRTVKSIFNQAKGYSQNNELTELATGIELESWESDEVLQYLHAKLQSNEVVSLKSVFKKDQSIVPESSISIIHQIKTTKQRSNPQINKETMNESFLKLSRIIYKMAGSEEKVELPIDIHTTLRNLCYGKKWHESRILAANILLHDPLEEELRKLFESTYCISLSYDQNIPQFSMEELTAICLGTIIPIMNDQKKNIYYYTDRNSVTESVFRAFLQGINPYRDLTSSTLDLKAELASDLHVLLEKTTNDNAYRWVLDLVYEARIFYPPGNLTNGATVLFSVIWDKLTGTSDPAKSRSKLLLLCYQLNLIDDVIASLAKSHAAPYDYLIIQFLRAIRSAEANEVAWDEARRLAQSFVEQVPANKMKPWRVLIDTLNRSRKNDLSFEKCAFTLENCSRQDNNTFLLELSITPSAYTIIETAKLDIGDDTSSEIMPIQSFDLISEGDLIAREEIKKVEIKLVPSVELLPEFVFPYRLTVRTTAGTNIEQRDRWPIILSKTDQPPLPYHIISNLWKGADGNPVDSILKAYHGREKETSLIQQLLSGMDGRQKSALVIGQRRIGKTSLLVESLRHYPPKDGHVCAVFSQFGGIHKRTSTEPLGETFFRALTELFDVTGYNREFCQMLSESLGGAWLRKLRKGLNPSTSISAALSTFVDRVAQATNGCIQRIAFFADEFQDVFKYPPEEVDQVMWGIRPLVQMSPTISLVFAGSGLTKELIRDYDKAFFGSIATINLRPFSIENEFKAIADTFIPEEARQYLCPNFSNMNALVTEAYHLTGGHPWYLSMLGRSSANQSQGRILTPVLLREVAKKMVIGQSDFQDKEIGAARFYGHLFDSLDSLGRQKQYAQLVLANIARQVTIEWPWLTATQAINGPKIEQVKCSAGDTLDALRKLKDEEILDYKIDEGAPKYRIRIPLVAEAVRYDADDIEYRASEMII